MADVIQTIYNENLFYIFLRKHYCPKCNSKLIIGYDSEFIDPKSLEGKRIRDFGEVTYITKSDVEIRTCFFECSKCDFKIGFKEMKEQERAKKGVKMFDKPFEIKIDSSNCTSLIEGSALFEGKNTFDSWRFNDIRLESGKIYGLISEYKQGSMYLSYLLGGRVDFGDLRIFCNGVELSKEELRQISWNLEPTNEKYKNAIVRKSIVKAIDKNGCIEDFDAISKKFILTEPRYDRKLMHLSGERWRASAALGYANRKKIFYAPYKPSNFYYSMCQTGLLKVLRELTSDGAIVLLPVGSDKLMKHIADECIYIDSDYDVLDLKNRYNELFGKAEWINL